jgi:DtxR family manganese transport transcriptional regulator
MCPPPAADSKARNRFVRARDARQGEIAEDYVELIDDLIRERGEARAAEIARALGVSHVTVIRTVGRLARDGLVATEPYSAVMLTEAGRTLAARARARHEIVAGFLRAIGVDEVTAREDAEGMEHHASETTLDAMQKMMKFLRKAGRLAE